MKSVNRTVACTPFPTNETKVEAKGGLPVIKQRHELTGLVVVYDSDDGTYAAGDTVYFSGDVCKHPQGRQVYEVEPDKPFILLPQEWVRVVLKVKAQSEFETFARGAMGG